MTSHSTSSSVLRRPGHPALSYTLHHPSTPTNHLALLAHPLGRLGGSQRDPLILALTQMLVGEGWTVCTYDARGAGESEGSASWTCIPEAEDYQAILASVLLPLASSSARTNVLLAGYSAGSLSASHCPLPSLPSPHPPPRVRRLLVSYPLSVRRALTLHRAGTFAAAVDARVQGQEEVLEIHGDQDQFTAVGRYRAWAGELGRESSAMGATEGSVKCRWRTVDVEGADHFWREKGARERLEGEVRSWLREEGQELGEETTGYS